MTTSKLAASQQAALGIAATALVALAGGPAFAQATWPTRAPGVKAGGTVLLACNASGAQCSAATDLNPLATGGVRESFPLVAANVPGTPATAYGGDYILSQTCTAYGTLTLQVRGPDGSTWLTLLTKTASDTGSGTGLALGSYAVVRVTVTGTTGCNAILARVPA